MRKPFFASHSLSKATAFLLMTVESHTDCFLLCLLSNVNIQTVERTFRLSYGLSLLKVDRALASLTLASRPWWQYIRLLFQENKVCFVNLESVHLQVFCVDGQALGESFWIFAPKILLSYFLIVNGFVVFEFSGKICQFRARPSTLICLIKRFPLEGSKNH